MFESIPPAVKDPICDSQVATLFDDINRAIIASPEIIGGDDVEVDICRSDPKVVELVRDVISLSLIGNSDVDVFMLVQRIDHRQPGPLQLELVPYRVPVLRPLQPGSLVPFPFGRHMETGFMWRAGHDQTTSPGRFLN
jgi:hypothetical protein